MTPIKVETIMTNSAKDSKATKQRSETFALGKQRPTNLLQQSKIFEDNTSPSSAAPNYDKCKNDV